MEHSHGERRFGNVIVYLFICFVLFCSQRELISVGNILHALVVVCLFVLHSPIFVGVQQQGQLPHSVSRYEEKEQKVFVWLQKNDDHCFVLCSRVRPPCVSTHAVRPSTQTDHRK